MVTERADGALDIDARLPIEDFEARFGPVLTEDEREADIDTVGGLVFTLAGRVPARGEVLSHPSGCEFRVLDADARRIRRLRVRRAPAAQGRSGSRRRSRAALGRDATDRPCPAAHRGTQTAIGLDRDGDRHPGLDGA